MNSKKLTLKSRHYPDALRDIHNPPALYHLGADLNRLLERPALAIVGTRSITPYGEMVTANLARQLADQGIVIVSGLAMGVDAVAHTAALEVGGLCIAVLPSPLDNVVPVSNRRLAKRILEQGGALVSEYAPGEPPLRQNFIARNRIMSGLSQAVLITEAGDGSGALHTANYAHDQNRGIMAVPGSIYNSQAVGTNRLIKNNEAQAVTELKDVLNFLDLKLHGTPAKEVRGRNALEQTLLDLMLQGITAGEVLIEKSGLDASRFNRTLTMLEISGKVRPLGANHWAIA